MGFQDVLKLAGRSHLCRDDLRDTAISGFSYGIGLLCGTIGLRTGDDQLLDPGHAGIRSNIELGENTGVVLSKTAGADDQRIHVRALRIYHPLIGTMVQSIHFYESMQHVNGIFTGFRILAYGRAQNTIVMHFFMSPQF